MTYQQILEFLRSRLAKAGLSLIRMGEASEYRPGMISANLEIKEKFDYVPVWNVAYRLAQALGQKAFVWQLWRATPISPEYHLAVIIVDELRVDMATTALKPLPQAH